jgi:TM2 domain-containing membrane protein YozV
MFEGTTIFQFLENTMSAPVPTSFVDAYMKLNDQQRLKFDLMYQGEAKSPDVGLICAVFGVYFFYMGQIGKGIALLVSCMVIVGWVWWVITIVNAKKEVNAHNEALAQRTLNSVGL